MGSTLQGRCLFVALALVMIGWAGLAGAGEVWRDDSGQAQETGKSYRRIISLYGAHTENLLALGAAGELVGVTTGDRELTGAEEKTVFSYHDDLERFLAARPDLILVRPMIWRGYRPLLERLIRSGIAVVSLQPHGVNEMYEYWRRLGELSGRRTQADKMARDFAQGVEGVKRRVADRPVENRPRVFFEAIHARMKTVAPDSMAAFCLETAGGINAAADAQAARGTNIAEYGKERILALAPTLDVYLAQVGTMNRVSVEAIKTESGFSAIKAVAQGRVHLVDEALVSRPTLRLLQGMAFIQGLLYPDLAGGGRP
jgi:iron complex transport system substrate-binding protein